MAGQELFGQFELENSMCRNDERLLKNYSLLGSSPAGYELCPTTP
jgi:hypothetical protein